MIGDEQKPQLPKLQRAPCFAPPPRSSVENSLRWLHI